MKYFCLLHFFKNVECYFNFLAYLISAKVLSELRLNNWRNRRTDKICVKYVKRNKDKYYIRLYLNIVEWDSKCEKQLSNVLIRQKFSTQNRVNLP